MTSPSCQSGSRHVILLHMTSPYGIGRLACTKSNNVGSSGDMKTQSTLRHRVHSTREAIPCRESSFGHCCRLCFQRRSFGEAAKGCCFHFSLSLWLYGRCVGVVRSLG